MQDNFKPIAATLTLFALLFIFAAKNVNMTETAGPKVMQTVPKAEPAPMPVPVLAKVLKVEPKKQELEVITLTTRNSFTFRDVVTSESATKLQQKVIRQSNKVSKTESFYLTIDSPGGSIIAGKRLIDSLQALPQKIKTINLFSASMAFQMAQNLDERLVTPSGILMSHRASGGFEGEFGSDGKGELMTRLKWTLKIIENLDVIAANRMNVSLPAYQTLIADEYWVTGVDAVKDNAADRVVLVKCDEDLLNGAETVVLTTFIGPVTLVYSACPLLSYPLEVKFSFFANATDEQKAKAQSFLEAFLKDKRTFVQDYIINNKYNTILQ